MNIPWEKLSGYFNYKIPVGVLLILFFIGLLFYIWASSSFRKGTKVLMKNYHKMIDDLRSDNSLLRNEKAENAKRISELENKLLDLMKK